MQSNISFTDYGVLQCDVCKTQENVLEALSFSDGKTSSTQSSPQDRHAKFVQFHLSCAFTPERKVSSLTLKEDIFLRVLTALLPVREMETPEFLCRHARKVTIEALKAMESLDLPMPSMSEDDVDRAQKILAEMNVNLA